LPIRLVVRTHDRGLSSAVVEGFAHAHAPVLLVMDADLSHPASTIPALYHAILKGAEFAIGSRYVPGGGTDDRWSWYRWLNSKVAAMLARPLVPLQDPTAGFFALEQTLVQRCEHLNPIGYKIALEILVKSKATRIQEIPIFFQTRRFGKSKLKLKQQLLYLRHLLSLYCFKFAPAPRVVPPSDNTLSGQAPTMPGKEKVG
jgi:dolichol-phosphate mannosyltransferase